MKKKIFTLLFAIVASIGTVFAYFDYSNPIKVGSLYYVLDNEIKEAEVTRSRGEKYSGSITIPASFVHEDITYSVTEIGGCAFQGCTDLISLTIPNSVTKIHYWAFVDCKNLTSLNIPGSVTHLDVFEGFADGCINVTAINVAEDNPMYCSIDGDVYSKDKTKFVLIAPGKQGTFNIPNYVTEIGEGSFHGCLLTNIMIPDGVTSIGSFAFERCRNLTSLEIPNSVVSIDVGIFARCSSLTSLTIGENAASIGGGISGCDKLSVIYNYSKKPQDLELFGDEEDPAVDVFVCKVYVPKESIPLYRVANGWRDFAYIEAIEDILEDIEDVQSNRTQSTKFIENGHVFVDKNGRTYNVVGVEVK